MWRIVGNAVAGDTWKTVGQCKSELIRVAYYFPSGVPNRVILGHLRQRWDAQTFDARWYRLYPKSAERETYELRIPPEFQDAYYFRELQIKQAHNWRWGISIEEWI